MSSSPLGTPSRKAPVLAINGLTVEYPLADGTRLTAAADVDLEIAAGEIHALVGESGAGKTTVGNALMGLLQRRARSRRARSRSTGG